MNEWELCEAMSVGRASVIVVTYVLLLCTQRPTDRRTYCVREPQSSHVASGAYMPLLTAELNEYCLAL